MTDSAGNDAKIAHEQVKLLFDYTKFHIGLYTTLGTLLIGAVNLSDKVPLKPNPDFVWIAVLCIGVAGLAGGVIASTLPHCSTLATFWSSPTGPYGFRVCRGETWTYIEHTAFWMGLIAAAGSLFCRG